MVAKFQLVETISLNLKAIKKENHYERTFIFTEMGEGKVVESSKLSAIWENS